MPLGNTLNVVRDPIDLRDMVYWPNLRRLPEAIVPAWVRGQAPPLTIRNQGLEGTCTGQALAAVVDVQRRLDTATPAEAFEPCSARMLFQMALSLETAQGRNAGVYTLRAAIKGFYNNGVCLDAQWPYHDGNPKGDLTVERAKAARRINLGAYFRVQPVLDDFHSALHEAGAVYVAASLHDGWSIDSMHTNSGRIVQMPGTHGMHAVALVGYNEAGFLVLNSWGAAWGGYLGCPGVGLWPYQDWADNVRDAWVLRLAVPTPEDFHVAVGEQGFYHVATGPIRTGTPRLEVIGHYLQFDDGHHVGEGSFPSNAASLAHTAKLLEHQATESPRKYRHVLLWCEGHPEPAQQSFRRIASSKRFWKAHGVYLIHLLWAHRQLESLLYCLPPIFESARKQAGQDDEACDRLVAAAFLGLGRAIWRDLHRAAEATAARKAAGQVLRLLLPMAAQHDVRLHLGGEGLGALLQLRLLQAARKAGLADLLPRLSTLILVNPTVTAGQVQAALGPDARTNILLYRTDADDPHTSRVGEYSRPWPCLVGRVLAAPAGDDGAPQFLAFHETAVPKGATLMLVPEPARNGDFPDPLAANPAFLAALCRHFASPDMRA